MQLIKMKSSGRWIMVMNTKWHYSEWRTHAVNTVAWFATGRHTSWEHLVYTQDDPAHVSK